MKPDPFVHHAPRTMGEVTFLRSTHQNCRLLAGGQSLMAMMDMRFATPDHLIDLNSVEGLASIEVAPTHLHRGAIAPQRDIEFSSAIEARQPIMFEAMRHVGRRQTRNRGTNGNSLYEWMAFSEDAQPLTTNLADYLLMTSTDERPKIKPTYRESPSPLKPLGAKGVFEAGVIPISAAIVSAIEDALSDFDVRLHRVPVKLSELSELIENASPDQGQPGESVGYVAHA